MSYISRHNRKPPEFASKSNHTEVINDPEVSAYLQRCQLPKDRSEIDLEGEKLLFELPPLPHNPIKYVVAIDGGYTEAVVKKHFPSATIAFLQFGALLFPMEELEKLGDKPFLFPEDMAKFKNLKRIKLTLPVRGITYDKEGSLLDSIRRTIYDFFMQKQGEDHMMTALRWFLFEEYNSNPESYYRLASCPNPECEEKKIPLYRNQMGADFTFSCPACETKLFLTDVFRLHEAVDEEMGAGGILGYLITLVEQMYLVFILRHFVKTNPDQLKSFLFIKDGPLGFFGQTANMHKPMRKLCNWLLKKHNLFLVGLEKSGAFAEHAHELCMTKSLDGTNDPKVPAGSYLLFSNEYIYTNILPGNPKEAPPYARTSYYGGKLLFRSDKGDVYVASVPVPDEYVVMDPTPEKYANLEVILHNLAKLRCDMYENSLVPIALANQVVSLAHHPSSVLLEKFAGGHIQS